MTDLSPIRKTIQIPLTPQQAFDLFALDIGSWWPLASHSMSGDQARTCGFEPQVGGQLYEQTADGTRHIWGRVLAWEPPGRLLFSWFLHRDEAQAQHVEVHFEPAGEGTQVTLEHRDWYLLGDDAAAVHAQYDPGWDFVLGRFLERVPAGQSA